MSAGPIQVVKLGQRKLISLKRRQDSIQVLGLVAVWVPILAFTAGGGLLEANSAVGFWSAINRLSALVATSLLILHVGLIARIPWVERTLGLDKLTATHKKLGKPILFLLLLHFFASVVTLSLIEGESLASTLVRLNLSYLSIASASLSLVLLAVVVVSSVNLARKKLSYEAWYLVHLLSYAAIFSAIPHQFEFGTDFLSQPLLATYFVFLYVFVASNLLWFRFLQPLVFALTNGLRVIAVKPEANRTTSITISGKRIQRMGTEAGQFFILRVLTLGQWWRPHPFSVSNSPSHEIRFTVGNRGDDTAALQNISVGTRVILEGPYGVFSESKRTHQHVTLLAAGIGVAPVRALAESLAAEPGDVTVLYRTTDEHDSALLDEVRQICERRGHVFHLLAGRRAPRGSFLAEPNKGAPSLPDHVRLLNLSPMLLESDIYVCGPSAWTHSVNKSLKKLRISKDQIHIEEFAW